MRVEYIQCARKYWDIDKIEPPLGSPAMKGVKNGRNSSTEDKPIELYIERVISLSGIAFAWIVKEAHTIGE